MIKRSFTYLDKDTFIKLYKSLVRPHLKYGNTIWHPHLKRQSISVEKVQRRATKLLYECKDMSYSERLNYLNLHSLKGRRLRGDLIETYKYFNNVYDVSCDKIFCSTHEKRTRNPEGKIFIRQCKTNKRKNVFSYRVASHWNILPNTTKFTTNINNFKNLLDSDPKFANLFIDFDE